MTSPSIRRRVRQGIPYDRRRIRRLRIEMGLSQTALADLAGLSTSQMSAIETGKHGPSEESLASIAKVLGCKIADLLHGGKRA